MDGGRKRAVIKCNGKLTDYYQFLHWKGRYLSDPATLSIQYLCLSWNDSNEACYLSTGLGIERT